MQGFFGVGTCYSAASSTGGLLYYFLSISIWQEPFKNPVTWHENLPNILVRHNFTYFPYTSPNMFHYWKHLHRNRIFIINTTFQKHFGLPLWLICECNDQHCTCKSGDFPATRQHWLSACTITQFAHTVMVITPASWSYNYSHLLHMQLHA